MKHELTIEQRLTGARKAFTKLERMGPRYRGLVTGIKKNIRNLEEYRARGLEFMPYKDRETYLRKQREFYARRTPRIRVQKQPVPVRAPASNPNKGIALRFEPTAKEKFQVDDCGNARRIVSPDES